MITVFDPKETICIRLKENSSDFIVIDLETLEEKVVPIIKFYGPDFKYDGEFKRAFLNVFPGKSIIIFFSEAYQKLEEIRYFNRVDW